MCEIEEIEPLDEEEQYYEEWCIKNLASDKKGLEKLMHQRGLKWTGQ